MIRNTGLKYIHVEDTNEGITTLDVVIEIPDRRLGFVGLDQERNLTQPNGQRILVDSVVAVVNRLPDVMPDLRQIRVVAGSSLHLSEPATIGAHMLVFRHS